MLSSIWHKLLDILNIKADENQKILLWSLVVSELLITYICPTLQKKYISDLPAQFIALQAIVGSVSGLIIGAIWKGKLRSTALKYFVILASAESLAGFLIGMYLCFIEFNTWVYAISSLIYSSLISTFVCKCIMVFKSKMWNERARETYDNNLSIVGGIVCILGFSVSIIALPGIKLAAFLWGLCCIIDDIGWIIVYLKNREILIEKDEKG